MERIVRLTSFLMLGLLKHAARLRRHRDRHMNSRFLVTGFPWKSALPSLVNQAQRVTFASPPSEPDREALKHVSSTMPITPKLSSYVKGTSPCYKGIFAGIQGAHPDPETDSAGLRDCLYSSKDASDHFQPAIDPLVNPRSPEGKEWIHSIAYCIVPGFRSDRYQKTVRSSRIPDLSGPESFD